MSWGNRSPIVVVPKLHLLLYDGDKVIGKEVNISEMDQFGLHTLTFHGDLLKDYRGRILTAKHERVSYTFIVLHSYNLDDTDKQYIIFSHESASIERKSSLIWS